MGRISPLFSVWDGYPCQETPPSNVPSATTNCGRRLNKLKDAIQITNRSNIPPPTFRYRPHASYTDTAHHLSAKYGWRNWWNICSLVDVQRNDSGCLAWHELSHKSDLWWIVGTHGRSYCSISNEFSTEGLRAYWRRFGGNGASNLII